MSDPVGVLSMENMIGQPNGDFLDDDHHYHPEDDEIGSGSIGTIDTTEMINRFYDLCTEADSDDPVSWDSIRACFHALTAQSSKEALEQLGEFARCPLHLVCLKKPPTDLVEMMLNRAPDCAEFCDIFGWTALHIACAQGASTEVIHLLIQTSEYSAVAADKKGRTPLHFGLNLECPVSPESIKELGATGAAKYADENGMLAIHYACAYGVTEEVLRNLIVAYPNSTSVKDSKGRVALHWVMSNGDRQTSPALVTNLVSISPETVNFVDKEGDLPLHLLGARALARGVNQENIIQCLKSYLGANPYATVDFLTALQSMPGWLRDVAVLTPSVQVILNQKIAKRVPSSILMLDFYCLILLITMFTLGVYQSIDIRASGSYGRRPDYWIILCLYICAGYLITREVIQIMALWSLGLFTTWLYDLGNYLDLATITMTVTFTGLMEFNAGHNDAFQIGATLSIGLFWASTLFYIKSVNIEFAVFVGGVYFVLRNLVAFLVSAVIFLLAFAQIFFSLFVETDYCDEPEFYYCELHTSFVQTITWMLGQIDDTIVDENPAGIVFFLLFVFFIIIILSTVLIAIVTDNYILIKGERAALVFWNNRLDYVAEMDAITNGPWKQRIMAFILPPEEDVNPEDAQPKKVDDFESFGRDFWVRLVSIYENENLHVMSIDFWAYTVLRIATALFICLILFPLGLVTAGWLWPPQIREYLFINSMASVSDSSSSQADDRKLAMKALIQEVSELRDIVGMKVMSNRNEINNLRDQLREIQDEMINEIKVMKDLTLSLYELKTGERVQVD